MADPREVIWRRPCLFCRTIQYYREGDDIVRCVHCNGEKFGPGSLALKPPRGYELSELDREILLVNKIDPED